MSSLMEGTWGEGNVLGVSDPGLGRSLGHLEACVWHAGDSLSVKQTQGAST